jgi:hypothetical protein
VLHAHIPEEIAVVCTVSVEDEQSGAVIVSPLPPSIYLRDEDLTGPGLEKFPVDETVSLKTDVTLEIGHSEQ